MNSIITISKEASVSASEVSFVFGIDPKPKNGFRFTKSGHRYTPSDVKTYCNLITAKAKEQFNQEMIVNKALGVEVTFWIKRPKSIPKKRIYCRTKPDLDNLEKALWDSIEKVAFDNDSRIASKFIEKKYSERGAIEVLIRTIE